MAHLARQRVFRMNFSALFKQPIFLLLLTGSLGGLNFPLGKLATDAGISPIIWALLISFGASVSLLPFLRLNKILRVLKPNVARYAFISGMISFAGVNLLLFSVIPHVGSGYAGLMFALSPVFTLTLSLLFRFKSPGFWGVTGIAVGFVGAATVALSKQSTTDPATMLWVIAALFLPVTLAVGNVYRSLAWPDEESPDVLAFWSHVFAAIILLVLLVATSGINVLQQLLEVPVLALAQILVAGLMFPVYFRLQKYGGPVLLSQMGYVIAAVGLIAATLFLNETYPVLTWIGAGIIALGIATTIFARRSN